MSVLTIEELTILVGFLYFLCIVTFAIGMFLLAKYDAYKARKRREKFKNDIANEVCAQFLF